MSTCIISCLTDENSAIHLIINKGYNDVKESKEGLDSFKYHHFTSYIFSI